MGTHAHPYGVHRRAGFTLIEMMMAIVLTLIVFAITVPFFRMQTNAIDQDSGRLDALQNARYAQNQIDRELRLAGGATGQPLIVQASPYAITFNVDLVARVLNDPNSVYYDPATDTLAAESWEPSRAKTLPTSTKLYPLQFYNDANGVQSPAETISYMLYVDPAAGRPDLYILYRRINDRDSVVIARNLQVRTDTNYFFRYYKTDATGAISLIPQASLPIYWDSPNAQADSIRLVEMRVSGLYRDVKRARDVVRTLYHKTRLLNAGMLKERTCGSAPLGPVTVTSVRDTTAGGSTADINVTWTRSLEELGGEADVATYLIMRRRIALPDWEVLGNMVALGSASYTFLDTNFASGTWIYGVSAQDCTPANSAPTAAPALVIP